MSFIRRQVGLRDDPASSTGSLHAKVTDLKNTTHLIINSYGCKASDNLKVSANTSKSMGTNYQEWHKRKEIYVNFTGTIRVSWQVEGNSAHNSAVSGMIYVNGLPRGIVIAESGSSVSYAPVTKTEDISVQRGDAVQLYAKATADWGYVRNFRVYYDIVSNLDTMVVLD